MLAAQAARPGSALRSTPVLRPALRVDAHAPIPLGPRAAEGLYSRDMGRGNSREGGGTAAAGPPGGQGAPERPGAGAAPAKGDASAGGASPPLPSRTNWTRLVPPHVLSGHERRAPTPSGGAEARGRRGGSAGARHRRGGGGGGRRGGGGRGGGGRGGGGGGVCRQDAKTTRKCVVHTRGGGGELGGRARPPRRAHPRGRVPAATATTTTMLLPQVALQTSLGSHTTMTPQQPARPPPPPAPANTSPVPKRDGRPAAGRRALLTADG